MKITLIPQRRNDVLSLSKSGDTLIINDESYDFSGVPEGATLPREAVDCDWLASDVERVGAALHMTLILPHGARAPRETLFPEPIIVKSDGPVSLPAHSLPKEEPSE